MVCNRCKMVVKEELQIAGYHPTQIELGEVDIQEQLQKPALDKLNAQLVQVGFELINNRKATLIEKIKTLLIERISGRNQDENENISLLLARMLHYEYNYLSNLFSEVEGTTIEKYFISLKIEKVKELLMYDELSLSEIAYKLGYSSVAHLSSQFKKVTGLAPSFYKELKANKRRNIDEL